MEFKISHYSLHVGLHVGLHFGYQVLFIGHRMSIMKLKIRNKESQPSLSNQRRTDHEEQF